MNFALNYTFISFEFSLNVWEKIAAQFQANLRAPPNPNPQPRPQLSRSSPISPPSPRSRPSPAQSKNQKTKAKNKTFAQNSGPKPYTISIKP